MDKVYNSFCQNFHAQQGGLLKYGIRKSLSSSSMTTVIAYFITQTFNAEHRLQCFALLTKDFIENFESYIQILIPKTVLE
jgi:hypothetical protein